MINENIPSRRSAGLLSNLVLDVPDWALVCNGLSPGRRKPLSDPMTVRLDYRLIYALLGLEEVATYLPTSWIFRKTKQNVVLQNNYI